jgi:hypothetical protein
MNSAVEIRERANPVGTTREQSSKSTQNESTTLGVDGEDSKEVTMRGFVIGALVVAVGVLGYMYWDSENNTLIKAPGVEIKKN